MFVIGFVSSFLAVQAAVSRCIWGAARDRSLPGSKVLGGLAGPERLPVNAIALTAVAAIVFVLLAGTQFYNILVNFNIIGFYIAFGVPVIGAALARLTGKWKPGPFNLGRWGAPITYIASLWIIFETVNVAWPRTSAGRALVHQLGQRADDRGAWVDRSGDLPVGAPRHPGAHRRTLRRRPPPQ